MLVQPLSLPILLGPGSEFVPNGSITAPAQQSAYFDGETGYYSFANTADWTIPNSDWAMVFLVKNDYSQGAQRYLIDNGSAGAGFFRLYLDTGRPWANFRIGANSRFMNSTPNINNQQFTVLTLQRNGSNYELRSCPLGGNTVTSHFTLAHTDATAQALLGTTIYMGARFDQAAGNFLNQYLSWFAKADGSALSDAQIISLASGTDVNSLGLNLRIHCKLTGESSVSDLTGNGNTGTRVGNVYPRGTLAVSGQPFAINGNDNTTRGFVYQRVAGGTAKSLSFSGTYNGAPAGIEARICSGQGTQVMPWTACTSPSAGNWEVAFANVPQGSGYYLEVRDTVVTTNLARSIWHFGVGAVFIWTGQSNATGMFGSNGSHPASNDLFMRGTIRQSTGTYLDFRNTVNRPSGVMPVIDHVSAQIGCPVMAVDAATGGSGLVGGWDTIASAFYQTFLSRLSAIGGDVEGVLWVQGEADGTSGTASSYYTSFGTFIGNARASVGRSAGTLPIYTAILGRKGSTSSPDNWAVVRSAQMDAETGYSNVKLLGGYYDLPYTDDLHMTGPGYAKFGSRVSQALLNDKVPGSYPTGMKGPEPVSAVRSGSTIIVTFTMNNGTNLRGLSSNNGITGFSVVDGSAVAQTITSADITAANQITLTMGTAPAAGWVVRYVPSATFDNSNMAYSDAPVIGVTTNDTVTAMPTRSPIILA